jgi:succinate dehydrogenase/fumarate reductase iron-sulfur protein
VSEIKWHITLLVSRQKTDGPRTFQSFSLEVDPEEYVLDVVERVWAYQDRSLCFRHACHHSTCGACGMLVNGVERLTCITPIKTVTHNAETMKIEPLRNFPIISDLVVDMGQFYLHMEAAHAPQVSDLDGARLPFEIEPYKNPGGKFERLVDCIECGCCVSACPAAHTSSAYLGPAVLAGIQHAYTQTGDINLLDMADHQNGVWRCHSAYECSAVCPSNVDPAWRIMDLRKKIVSNRLKTLFHRREPVHHE